jgi:hypothetical protein
MTSRRRGLRVRRGPESRKLRHPCRARPLVMELRREPEACSQLAPRLIQQHVCTGELRVAGLVVQFCIERRGDLGLINAGLLRYDESGAGLRPLDAPDTKRQLWALAV